MRILCGAGGGVSGPSFGGVRGGVRNGLLLMVVGAVEGSAISICAGGGTARKTVAGAAMTGKLVAPGHKLFIMFVQQLLDIVKSV